MTDRSIASAGALVFLVCTLALVFLLIWVGHVLYSAPPT
jgi:hypothetical protein